MSTKKYITIRDVAQMAAVSPGTVSRAINGSPLVNAVTRRQVLEVVERLQYVPNPIAQRLSTRKTLAIGLIVPFLTRPSVSERLYGAVQVLARSPYDLVIQNIELPEQREACFRDLLRRQRVDGVIVLSLPLFAEDIAQLGSADVPIVLIDTCHPQLSHIHSVTVDDVAGGSAAAGHLLQLGHTRIAFLGDRVDDRMGFVSSHSRYAGYRNALRAAGVALRPEYYSEDVHGRHPARAQALKLLQLPDPPTAIFAASDTQAVGVLEAAREMGLRVPQDLSVIGYDDVEMADILLLTTIRQRLADSGRIGVQLLLDAIQKPDLPPVHQVLPTELVVRETTAPPAP